MDSINYFLLLSIKKENINQRVLLDSSCSFFYWSRTNQQKGTNSELLFQSFLSFLLFSLFGLAFIHSPSTLSFCYLNLFIELKLTFLLKVKRFLFKGTLFWNWTLTCSSHHRRQTISSFIHKRLSHEAFWSWFCRYVRLLFSLWVFLSFSAHSSSFFLSSPSSLFAISLSFLFCFVFFFSSLASLSGSFPFF